MTSQDQDQDEYQQQRPSTTPGVFTPPRTNPQSIGDARVVSSPGGREPLRSFVYGSARENLGKLLSPPET